MSYAYDQYLAEHIGNVNKGLHWMLDNLGFKEEKASLEEAMASFNHDESKYSTEEYDAYDKYFYGGNRSYKVVQDFNYAWLHHIHNNPHHWQYWVLLEDDPESGLPYKTLPIPLPYIFEMIADWWSFSWKNGNLFEIFNWYAEHRDKQYINLNSRMILERILEKIWDVLLMQEAVVGHDISDIEGQYRRFWIEQKMDQLNLEHSNEEDHLEHHGILGQKWGIKNGPPYPINEEDHSKEEQKHLGIKNLNGAKTANIDKWGTDADHNVLYITGYSGSGKSTAALALKKPGDSVIHLDGYCDLGGSDIQNKKFNTYLNEHVENWNALPKATSDGEGLYKRYSKEYWSKVEEFDKAITDYSKEEFKKGNRVITEGVQISDEWLKASLSDYAGLPVVVLQNGPIKSMKRAFERDDRGNLLKGLKNLDDPKEYATWYYNMFKNLDKLADATGAKKHAYRFDDELEHSDTEESDEDLYGVPELKKFPMPDKKHVKSAIRFFNYVDPKYEKELAKAIIEKAEEFGLDLKKDIKIGDENMFKKYIVADDDENKNEDRVLTHYGIKGQTWGERRFQYADGSLTPEGRKRYLKESKMDPSNKKDNKKSEPLFDISKLGKGTNTPPGAPGPNGRVGTATRSEEPKYDQWEKDLYAEFEKSGMNPANMSDAEFKALLVKRGVLKEDAADSLVTTMKQKAMKNYKIYSKKDEPAATAETAPVTTDSNSEKKSRRGSGESSGSGSGAKKANSDAKPAEESEKKKEPEEKEPEKTEETSTNKPQTFSEIEDKIYEKLDKKGVDSIIEKTGDELKKSLEEMTGFDLSDLTEQHLEYFKNRIQNHYLLENWEQKFKEDMNDILDKYPRALNNDQAFAKVLDDKLKVNTDVLDLEEVKKMRSKFVKMYLDSFKQNNEK